MSVSTSAFSTKSPILAGAGIPGKPKIARNGNGLGSASSLHFSPPPPPPPVVRGAEDYFVGEILLVFRRRSNADSCLDVEGDETGSSTDSDSD
jgi:hypothetical protein